MDRPYSIVQQQHHYIHIPTRPWLPFLYYPYHHQQQHQSQNVPHPHLQPRMVHYPFSIRQRHQMITSQPKCYDYDEKDIPIYIGRYIHYPPNRSNNNIHTTKRWWFQNKYIKRVHILEESNTKRTVTTGISLKTIYQLANWNYK